MKAFVLCLGLIQAKLVCDYGENCEEYCDDDICEYRNEYPDFMRTFRSERTGCCPCPETFELFYRLELVTDGIYVTGTQCLGEHSITTKENSRIILWNGMMKLKN